MSKKDLKYDTFKPLRWVLTVYTFFGLWHKGEKEKQLRLYGYTLHILFSTCFIILQVVNLFLKETIEEVFEWMFLAFCEVALLIKIWNLLLKNQVLRDVVDSLESMQPMSFEEETTFEQASGITFLAKAARVHYSVSVMAHISSSLVALLIAISGQFQCPYVQWFYGYKCITGGAFFYVAYAYQLFTITMHCLCNITTDIFISSIVSNLVGQTAVLGVRLQKMTKTSVMMKKKQTSETKGVVIVKPLQPVSSPVGSLATEHELEIRNNMIECINYYRKIKTLARTFQDDFQLPIFIQTLMSAFVICCSAYRLSGVSMTL